jgi:hypothetical protein
MKALVIIGGLALVGGAAIAIARSRGPTDPTAQRIREGGAAVEKLFGGLINFASTADRLLERRTMSTNESGGPATAVVHPKQGWV